MHTMELQTERVHEVFKTHVQFVNLCVHLLVNAVGCKNTARNE
jgi:hypothetical protein